MRKYRLNGSYDAGIGTALGVIFLCFGGFLMYQCHKYAPKQPEVMYAIGGVALLLAIVLSLLDLQNDKAAEQAKKHRARMLSMPAVTGHITAVRKRWYDRKGRELPAETAQHVHSDGIRPRWTATVTFTDPAGNTVREIESQQFTEDLEMLLSGDLCDVHYSPEGEYYVVPLEYRQSADEEPAFSQQTPRRQLMFSVTKHPYLAFAVIAAFEVIVVLILLAFVLPH